MRLCGVAALAKGVGHWLRTAPCLDASGGLCIRNSLLDGVPAILRWDLVPHWSKRPDSRYSMINARAEAV